MTFSLRFWVFPTFSGTTWNYIYTIRLLCFVESRRMKKKKRRNPRKRCRAVDGVDGGL